MLWSLQLTHSVIFSEPYWPGQLGGSPFSSELAPNLLSPSTSFSHRRNYNMLCWSIPPFFFSVYVLLRQAWCWPIPKLHKKPSVCFFGGRGPKGLQSCAGISLHNVLFSFGWNWERSHVVWWQQLGGKGGDSAGLWAEQCRGNSEEQQRSASSRPQGRRVLWAKSAQQAALVCGKERKEAVRGRTWSGCVCGLGDSVKKIRGTEQEVLCDLSAHILKWGSTGCCPWVYVRSWACDLETELLDGNWNPHEVHATSRNIMHIFLNRALDYHPR